MKIITAKFQAAYDLGRRVSDDYASESAVWNGMYDDLDAMGQTELAFFMQGFHGYTLPTPATGWRYGDIPKGGRSYNFRDERHEVGVSMMEVDGYNYIPDGSYVAMGNAVGKPVVRVEGFLIGATGSDGEGLFIGASAVRS